MNCLRCGIETENEQVFCDSCRAVMAQHPITPGTAVYIPQRNTPEPEKKQTRQRNLSPKETIRQMRGLIRWLTVTVAVMTAVICLLVGILLYSMGTETQPNDIGRNYNTINTTQPE